MEVIEIVFDKALVLGHSIKIDFLSFLFKYPYKVPDSAMHIVDALNNQKKSN